MPHISPRHLIAFVDELRKEAGYGKTLAIGAGLGGAFNYLRHRDEPDAMRHALRGAVGGAALTGAGILSTKSGREAAMNMLRRERYHLTGQGLGNNAEEQLQGAKKIGLIKPKYDTAQEAADELHRFQSGNMSTPGVVHNLLTKPGQTLREGWQRGGTLGKVFTGLGAVEAARGFASKPEEGGPGRLERGLSGVGQMIGGVAGPPGLAAGMLLSGGLGRLGKAVGRVGDRALGGGRVVPQQQYYDYPVGANG